MLSLTLAIVGVRFFGLARPVLRYLERLGSHDLALRALGRARVRGYERLEPLAPARLEGFRHGDLLSRLVADVDALQNLHLRGLTPPLVALAAGAVSVAVTAACLPGAAAVLAAGLVVGATAVPAAAVLLGRQSARREAADAGHLTAELVELVRGAPELVAYGRAGERLERLRRADAALVARRAAGGAVARVRPTAIRVLVTGATVVGVLAVSVQAHAEGRLDRVLIAALALLALASFEAVQPLGQSARELVETLAAGRRVLELTDREPAVADPADPVPSFRGHAAARPRVACASGTAPASRLRSTASAFASSPGAQGRAGRPERRRARRP